MRVIKKNKTMTRNEIDTAVRDCLKNIFIPSAEEITSRINELLENEYISKSGE